MVLPVVSSGTVCSEIDASSCNQAICDVAAFPAPPVSAMAFSMTHILLVAAGGAFGSVLRYLVGLWTLRGFGPSFPWGTLTVNVTGSFLIGLLAERSRANSVLRRRCGFS